MLADDDIVLHTQPQQGLLVEDAGRRALASSNPLVCLHDHMRMEVDIAGIAEGGNAIQAVNGGHKSTLVLTRNVCLLASSLSSEILVNSIGRRQWSHGWRDVQRLKHNELGAVGTSHFHFLKSGLEVLQAKRTNQWLNRRKR